MAVRNGKQVAPSANRLLNKNKEKEDDLKVILQREQTLSEILWQGLFVLNVGF